MNSIASWLAERGLQRYAAAFEAADIDLDVLADLSEADLEQLGVSLGDRKRIVRALKAPASDSIALPVPPVPPVPNLEHGERRQLTVLFCDLVGSTELAGRLDPEDLRATIVRYHACCSDVVARHGGEIAQFLGDGVMAQFGYPRAHEDDAQRAARCALDLIAEVRNLIFPDSLRLRTRVGLATGTEVVGDLPAHTTRDRMSVVGSTPSLAARLQGVAEPETAVVTTATRRLLRDAFALVELPSRVVKGFDDAMPLWQIEREIHGVSRFAQEHAAATSRCFGREFESGLLLDRWRAAVNGDGQTVLLTAEPGMGKSRVVEEFLARSHGESIDTIRLQCSPQYAASPLQPIRDAVEHAARFVPDDTTPERYAKLRALEARWPPLRPETGAAFALLLGVEDADRHESVATLTTEQRKALIFRSLLELVAGLARRSPLRIIVEDVHWIDPTTLDVLTQLFDAIASERVFIIVTARPEFVSPWSRYGHVASLTLNRLERGAAEEMVAASSGGTLSRELVARIVQRADGVPLFLEELTATVSETMAANSESIAIPHTLRDALTARLDGLDGDREIAQMGAVLGREFSIDALCVLAERDLRTMQSALERLVASGLVRRQGSSGVDFLFKHALVRDVAYESLLRPRRQALHLRAARAFERNGEGGSAGMEPELIAHHYEEAARPVEALPYWRLAAGRAIAASAYREAAAHLNRATVLVDRVPSDGGTTERDIRNLAGVVYGVLEGGRSQRAYASYTRAFELSASVPEDAGTFAALCGACVCDHMSGRVSLARIRSIELLALAERLGDPDLLLEALHTTWAIGASLGNVHEALEASRRGVAIYEPGRHHVHVTKFGTGHDSGVCGLGFGAQSFILAGHVGQGRSWIEKTKKLGAELDHPFSQCIGLQHAACAHAFLGEHEAALELAQESFAIAHARKFPMPLAFSKVISGTARMGLGDASGAELVASVVDDATNALPANWLPLALTNLSLHALRGGDTAQARARLQLALARSVEMGGCMGEPEIHLALARLASATGSADTTAHVEAAATHAQEFGAHFFELRAAIARVELLHEGGDSAVRMDANATLSGLLATFGSDDDCSDVRRARELVSLQTIAS